MEKGISTYLVTGSLVGIFALAGWGFKEAYDKEQDYKTLLDRLNKADVTQQICPDAKRGPEALALTIAPVMKVQDMATDKTVKQWTEAALDKGMRFAFCPLAQGTTSYEVIGEKAVLKLDAAATSQQQQAALLQFFKEWSAGVATPDYNPRVEADQALANRMPGRMPDMKRIGGYDKRDVVRMNIPLR
ncbi:MAG: hypothetical protein ACK4NR_03470 [Micavibrio sp.]